MYKRQENSNTIMKKHITFDSLYVVPYNPYLLKIFQAHIDMKWCNKSNLVKYLFKYINKEYDQITAVVVQNGTEGSYVIKNIDETKHYLDCWHVSPSEA